MVDLAASVWRDFTTDGVPSSGNWTPYKSKIRQWGTWLEGIITAFTSNGGLIYTSLAAMNADLAHGANSSAWVVGDATVANNGVYQKLGASGAGSWSRVADLPYSFIKASNAGTGSANAIVATTAIPLPANDGATLIALNITTNNTGAATVAFNGATALPIKTNSGSDVQANYLVAGAIVAGYVSVGTFRLLSDVASAADRAAAETAATNAAASAAAAAASAGSINLPSPAASTFLQRNAGNSAYVTQTAAQVRATLLAAGLIANADVFDPAGNAANGISAAKLFFLNLGANAVARLVSAKLDRVVELEDFGGKGDDSTDNLTAFQYANTYLVANGGGVIRLRRGGIYRLSAAVTLGNAVSVLGDHYASIIKTTSATADMLILGGNCVVRGVTFATTVTRTGGRAIGIDSVGQVLVYENLFNGHYIGIQTTGPCSLIWIRDNSIYKSANATSFGIQIGGGAGAVGNDFFIRDNFIRGAASGTQGYAGIDIRQSGGTYTSGNSILWCGSAYLIDPQNTQTVTWTFSIGDTCDTSTYGFCIAPAAGGSIKGTFIDGPWASTCTNNGIIVGSLGNIDGTDINNPRVFNNQQVGINVTGGAFLNINGGMVAGNSGASSGTYSGILVAAGISDFSIIGVQSGAGVGFGASHKYGIEIAAGASNNYIVMGCRLRANISGGVSDGGTGSTKQVGGNAPDIGGLDRVAPTTTNVDLTVASSVTDIIVTKGSTCTITLPSAATFPGRRITIRTTVAFTTVSASSNVLPLAGGAAGTAILAATAGKWADLISDGTNWLIHRAN
ncbi:hypothetical protein DPM33_32940 [Mesorhizobium hawassense]|uniref:Uncharacterized protein n=1 Tax=Mesorhizobium hawassense TaxID=1209954 RepID=A0A330H3K8_9HYPH|nr:hypothetical protein [Mesorhizobium hawassense]RAZ83191.1 hypothetical protein DPM33_32940 [Mesorhizobium hawassense]